MDRSTISSLMRATQALCGQLCEKHTFDFGIAYYCPTYPDLPEVNQLREVIIEDADAFAPAIKEVDAFFVGRKLSCRRWSSATGDATDQHMHALGGLGFLPRRYTAMRLTSWTDPAPDSAIRILPARAARSHYRRTFFSASHNASDRKVAALADAYNDRLDDPPFDAFVAMVDNQPAGRCTLHQVGDIGLVFDLAVAPAFAGGGAEITLLAHSLALAKRLMLRTICAQVNESDTAALARLGQVGFEPDGTIIEFERT